MSGTIFSSEESFSKKKNGFHLNLAFQSLEEIPADIIRKHACRTTSIDLSYNNFKYLFIPMFLCVTVLQPLCSLSSATLVMLNHNFLYKFGHN